MKHKTPTQLVIEKLEPLLPDYGLNVTKLCALADIARKTWYAWKAGDNEPNTRLWRRIEAALPPELKERIA